MHTSPVVGSNTTIRLDSPSESLLKKPINPDGLRSDILSNFIFCLLGGGNVIHEKNVIAQCKSRGQQSESSTHTHAEARASSA